MNKLVVILPLFLLSMCSDAPVTPPAGACSLPLDGYPTKPCPPPDVVCLSLDCPPLPKPKPIIPREAAQGEIDITSPYHLQSLQMMFMRNARRTEIEKNMTTPSDAINSALDDFMEAQYGSDDSTKQEKLL